MPYIGCIYASIFNFQSCISFYGHILQASRCVPQLSYRKWVPHQKKIPAQVTRGIDTFNNRVSDIKWQILLKLCTVIPSEPKLCSLQQLEIATLSSQSFRLLSEANLALVTLLQSL